MTTTQEASHTHHDHDHNHHNHGHCCHHDALVSPRWRKIAPRMFMGWGAAQIAMGTITGASALTSNGAHDLADGYSFRPQGDNAGGDVLDDAQRERNRNKAQNVLFALGGAAVVKSGLDLGGVEVLEGGAEAIEDYAYITMTSVSLALNSLVAIQPRIRAWRRRKEHVANSFDDKQLLTHVDLDVLSSLGAVTSSILSAKGIGYVDGAVGMAIGGATMYHFVPSWTRSAATRMKNVFSPRP